MKQSTTALFNGNYLPIEDVSISPFDRGFLFGDSIYEVVPIYDKVALGGTQHYQRLVDSLTAIGINSPYSVLEWAEKLQPTLCDVPAQMIYIQVTRGVEPVRKHRLPVDAPPTVLAFSIPFTPPISRDYAGGHGHLQTDLRWQRCDIKSTSLIGNILAYQQLYERGTANDEALLTRGDNVVEAPSSNLFIVKDNAVITPPLDNILAGVTRATVINLAKQQGLPTLELPLTKTAVKNADEVWVSNSYDELKPLISIDGEPVGDGKPGPIWLALFDAYQTLKGDLAYS